MYKQSFGQLTKKEGTWTAINPFFDYEIMWELNWQIWEKTYKIGSGKELIIMVPAFLASSLKHCLYISI